MISSEVQRTLVKSPPELWAELSDPAALARHLGELGEITITRIDPEKTVEWEAVDTTGKVLLKPSGWGTKVTLSVTREAVVPTTEPVETLAKTEPPITNEPELESVAMGEPIPEPEPVAVAEEPVVAAEEPDSEPQPRQGFFARLFRRRANAQTLPQAPAESPVDELPVEPAAVAEPEPAPEEVTTPSDEPPQDIPDIAAELKAAEEAATEEVTAVLTAVLDRLGAAHHRPFSRA